MENRKEYMTSLFSGRFDPPTMGHVISIQRLAMYYKKVIVVVLDYPEREACSASDAKGLFDLHFDMVLSPALRSSIAVIINDKHFGAISKEEIDGLGVSFDVYVTGNEGVLKHIKALGYKTEFLPRTEYPLEYSATDVRKRLEETGLSLSEYYNTDMSG